MFSFWATLRSKLTKLWKFPHEIVQFYTSFHSFFWGSMNPSFYEIAGFHSAAGSFGAVSYTFPMKFSEGNVQEISRSYFACLLHHHTHANCLSPQWTEKLCVCLLGTFRGTHSKVLSLVWVSALNWNRRSPSYWAFHSDMLQLCISFHSLLGGIIKQHLL